MCTNNYINATLKYVKTMMELDREKPKLGKVPSPFLLVNNPDLNVNNNSCSGLLPDIISSKTSSVGPSN